MQDQRGSRRHETGAGEEAPRLSRRRVAALLAASALCAGAAHASDAAPTAPPAGASTLADAPATPGVPATTVTPAERAAATTAFEQCLVRRATVADRHALARWGWLNLVALDLRYADLATTDAAVRETVADHAAATLQRLIVVDCREESRAAAQAAGWEGVMMPVSGLLRRAGTEPPDRRLLERPARAAHRDLLRRTVTKDLAGFDAMLAATPPVGAVSVTVPPDAGRPRTGDITAARIARGGVFQCPYPPIARLLDESGSVVLVFRVEPDGRSADIGVETSSGVPRLDAAAAACVQRVAFEPQRVDGTAVSSWQRLKWTWHLEDDMPPLPTPATVP